MNEIAVSVAGPLVGALAALLATALTLWLTSRHNVRDRDWRLQDEARLRLIERGEELYSLIHRWNLAKTTGAIFYPRVMRDEITYNDALDAVIESGRRDPQNFERIELIIDVYFPNLRIEYEMAHDLVHRAHKIESEFRRHYKEEPIISEEHATAFSAGMVAADKSIGKLGEHLAVCLRNISVISVSLP